MEENITEAIKHSLVRIHLNKTTSGNSVLRKLLSGTNCLLVAPTGAGKSCIFEAASLAMDY